MGQFSSGLSPLEWWHRNHSSRPLVYLLYLFTLGLAINCFAQGNDPAFKRVGSGQLGCEKLRKYNLPREVCKPLDFEFSAWQAYDKDVGGSSSVKTNGYMDQL